MKESNIKRLKVAFIGGGINSAVGSAHRSAISLDNIFNLVAGCFSRHKKINYRTAERYKVSKNRTYDSIDELVKNEKNNVDAVIVLTPTNQHASQVINLINNDIPVICEKSLACSGAEVEQIRTALQEKNGFLAVIYNYLGYPIIRELRHMIQKGILGKINHMQIEMPQEGFIIINQEGKPIVPQEWRLKDGIVPIISLDVGVHLHMFIKYLINETPINVVAKSETIGNFSEIVDNVNCIIEYANNLTCNMWYSKIAIGNRNGLKIRIYGSKASAEWLQEAPEILHLADVKGNRWKIDRGNQEVEISNQQRYTRFKVGHPAGFIEAFANYYQDIANALQNYKRSNIVNLKDCFGIEEAYEGIQLFEAIQRSGKSRTWEKV
jgi:predicted dehydrogenase